MSVQASCAAAMGHRSNLFRLNQESRSSASKVKFRQAGNLFKRVTEAAKRTDANKTKENLTSQKLGSRDFSQIAKIVLSKGKSVTLKGPDVMFSSSELLAKSFYKNSNLDGSGISLSAFPLRTNLKLHNIHVQVG